MFTDGLDNRARQWVNQGSGIPKKGTTFSTPNQIPSTDPIISQIRAVNKGFGLPPPANFRSGHLSGVIPVSRSIHTDVDDGVSDSDGTTESGDDEVYGRNNYSLDSSPQDDRIPNSTQRHYSSSQKRPEYGSDNLYSGDVSSSRETGGGARQRSVNGASRYPVRSNGYTEDECSDSSSSSEFSTTQANSVNGGPSRPNANASKKGFHARTIHIQKPFDDDIPSAPPFSGSTGEIKQDEKTPVSRAQYTKSTANSSRVSAKSNTTEKNSTNVRSDDNIRQRAAASGKSGVPSGSVPARLPTFHASALGPWHAVLSYDACVRLCLHAWAKGCTEAPMFLENECALLRSAFGLQQVLLQSEEELMVKRSTEHISEGAAPKPKKMVGKMKVQVRKVKMSIDPPTGCSILSLKAPNIKMENVKYKLSNFQMKILAGWQAVRSINFERRVPTNNSFSHKSLAYVQASTQYIKEVSGLLKNSVGTLRSNSSSYEVQETYSCTLRLKSSSEDDVIRMQPGSGETHVFFPDSLGDVLVVEVQDSKGKQNGRVLAQVAAIAEDPSEKLRWWSIYHEPEHELLGKIQLYINYSTSLDENSNLKCGSVAETVAYDLALETAMKVQHFQQRNLLLHGPWKWLLIEFASYYGVSDAYTKLRYLSYVMDVATPTADCLTLVHDLLLPVVMKARTKSTLSHQENRILGDIEDQVEQIFALVFENYKSLEESSPSGIMEFFKAATGCAAPALEPAIQLYTLLHDILSPESQNKLYSYFQAAAKKRSKRHLTETDEYVSGNNEGILMDDMAVSTAYQKMRSLCLNIRNEVFTDIEIHNQDILPSFIDLPNLSSAIYSAELCGRLRAFLIACPPNGPSPSVTDLVIATADFQKDLASWNILPVKGGVDAKELFHLYIILWIQDKRLLLLESCKLDKVKWSGVRTQHSTTPFVDEMYDRLKITMSDYNIIISRWPEYTFALENAIADVEKAIVETLEKQYADVLSPLKENLTTKKFGLKYVQKLAKRTICPYLVPDELGVLLNSMKRMLDILRPEIDHQLKTWGSCIPDAGGSTAAGDRLSEVTVMLRSKFRNYIQAVVEKLSENTRLQNSTKLKKILQDSKASVAESDIRFRMQPLIEQLTTTITHLHSIFEMHVFISTCRGYWDRMGQDMLSFLENRKENRSWYKGSQIAVAILDDTFASQMQQLLGNSLQEKDLEPPRNIIEVRSMLCKDAPSNKGSSYYY